MYRETSPTNIDTYESIVQEEAGKIIAVFPGELNVIELLDTREHQQLQNENKVS